MKIVDFVSFSELLWLIEVALLNQFYARLRRVNYTFKFSKNIFENFEKCATYFVFCMIS